MLLSSQCFSKDICKLIDSPYMRSFNCPSRDVMLNKITINFKVLSSFVIHLVHCNMYCNFVVTVKSRTFSLLLPKFPKQAPNPNSLGNSSSEEMRESPCRTQNPLIDLKYHPSTCRNATKQFSGKSQKRGIEDQSHQMKTTNYKINLHITLRLR